MNTCLEYLKKGDIEKAYQALQQETEQEQKKILSSISHIIQEITPQTIVILRRELKPNKTYQDFFDAWKPPVKALDKQQTVFNYYPVPVRVINAQHITHDREIISIGLISANEKKIMQLNDAYAKTDAARHDNLTQVAQSLDQAHLYTVRGIYTLGT